MSELVSMGICPFCKGGENTPCFATYSNGYFCFSCGKKKSTDKALYAFRPNLKTADSKLNVPINTQNIKEFSPQVLSWLYKYYVYEDLIRKYNISFVPFAEFGVFKGESLLFPHMKGGELVGYQRRFFPDKQFITAGSREIPFLICNHDTNMIVLVEDFISAIRVAEFTNVLCLTGTKLSYNALLYIVKFYSNIQLWLDNDGPGIESAKAIEEQVIKRMRTHLKYNAFAVKEESIVNIVNTEKQPKEHSNNEITNIIRGKNEASPTGVIHAAFDSSNRNTDTKDGR